MLVKPEGRSEKQVGGTQIIGFRLPAAIAKEVKDEATRRGIPLNRLFGEIWELYLKTKKGKV